MKPPRTETPLLPGRLVHTTLTGSLRHFAARFDQPLTPPGSADQPYRLSLEKIGKESGGVQQ